MAIKFLLDLLTGNLSMVNVPGELGGTWSFMDDDFIKFMDDDFADFMA